MQGGPLRPPVFFNQGNPMALDYEEAKTKIVEALTKKLKNKSKFYFNDLTKILGVKPREAKKIVNQLVQEAFWNTGPAAAPPCTACPEPASRPVPSTKINVSVVLLPVA
jgi:hypothetical protein